MKNLKFVIGDRVEIPELKRSGRVKAIYLTKSNVEYQVRYFDNAEARVIYFDEEDLEKVE